MTTTMERPRARLGWLPLAAGPLVLAAAAVVAWWLVGDLSFRPPPGVALDYLIVAPRIDPGVVTGTGIAALLIGTATLLGSVRAVRAGRLRGSWLTLLLLLVPCGLVIGWGGRVLTAGGIGANIGAGLLIVVVGPVLGVLLALAFARAVHLARLGPPR